MSSICADCKEYWNKRCQARPVKLAGGRESCTDFVSDLVDDECPLDDVDERDGDE